MADYSIEELMAIAGPPAGGGSAMPSGSSGPSIEELMAIAGPPEPTLSDQPSNQELDAMLAGAGRSYEAEPSVSNIFSNAVKSLAKGALDTGSMIVDYNPLTPEGQSRIGIAGRSLARNIGILPQEQSLYDKALEVDLRERSLGALLDPLRQEYIGNATPTNAVERYANKAIEFLPSALSSSPSALISAAGSGAGGELAEDIGAPEIVGQVAGGVAPSIFSSLIRPLTTSGQKALAGAELLSNAGKAGRENLDNALSSGATSSQFGPLTYAELAQTPSAAAFQTAIRKIPGEGADAIEAALTARAAGRESLLKEMAPDSLSGVMPSERGALLQPSMAEGIDEAWKLASKPYERLKEVEGLGVLAEKYAVQDTYSSLFRKSALGMNPKTKTIFSTFVEGPNVRSFDELKTLQSEAGEVLGELARTNPKSKDVKLLATLRNEIDNSLERNALIGKLPAEQVGALAEAKSNYAFTGEKFGSRTLKAITKKGDFGRGFQMPQENVPRKIIQSETSARDFIQAFGGDAELVTQARGALVDDMARKAPESWPKYFKEKEGVFGEIFWNDKPKVKAIVDDISSLSSVSEKATRASRGQSATSQFTTVAGQLFSNGPRALSKALANNTAAGGGVGASLLFGNLPAAAAVAATNRIARWSERNISDLVSRAMVSPELLTELSQKASEATLSATAVKLLPIAVKMATEQEGQGVPLGPRTEEIAIENKEKAVDLAFQQLDNKTPQPEDELAFYRSFNREDKMDDAPKTPKAVLPTFDQQDGTPSLKGDMDLDKIAPEFNEVMPVLRAALIKQESGGRADAVSNKGAQGLMQLMPTTAADIAKELGVKDYDIKDPKTNKLFGEYYLRKRLSQFGDVRLALAAYNAGAGKVKQWMERYGDTWEDIVMGIREDVKNKKLKVGYYNETLNYVPSILRKMEKITKV